jgi:hypothetical protein
MKMGRNKKLNLVSLFLIELQNVHFLMMYKEDIFIAIVYRTKSKRVIMLNHLFWIWYSIKQDGFLQFMIIKYFSLIPTLRRNHLLQNIKQLKIYLKFQVFLVNIIMQFQAQMVFLEPMIYELMKKH